jgi:hypothetical protein
MWNRQDTGKLKLKYDHLGKQKTDSEGPSVNNMGKGAVLNCRENGVIGEYLAGE